MVFVYIDTILTETIKILKNEKYMCKVLPPSQIIKS